MLVEDTLEIAAAPEIVWAITADVERWPEWTPTVTSVELEGDALALGVSARIRQPGQPPARWTVTAFEPGARFSWETRRTGLRMIATHELAPSATGTRNTLRVEASGALATLLAPLLRFAIRRALRQENRGLRSRCEGSA